MKRTHCCRRCRKHNSKVKPYTKKTGAISALCEDCRKIIEAKIR